MIFIDWIIVFIVLAGMIFSVNLSKGLMKSVTDFLSAGRTAGRYLIAVSSGIAGLGAISVVMFLEMGYVAGFSLAWWGLSQGIIISSRALGTCAASRSRRARCRRWRPAASLRLTCARARGARAPKEASARTQVAITGGEVAMRGRASLWAAGCLAAVFCGCAPRGVAELAGAGTMLSS